MKKLTGKLAETWGLGATAGALFALLVLTGGVLMLHYRPVVDLAWADVVDLREISWAGSFRKLHYWAAQVLIIVVWLHLLRTFLRGAHRRPRQGHWALGVVMLALTLAMATSGHLLPWDLPAVSGLSLHHPSIDGASTAATSLGSRHLLWIYVLHCVFLPALMVGLIAYAKRRDIRRPDIKRPDSGRPDVEGLESDG